MKRPNYFAGKILTAQDLRDEQTYFLEKLRLRNRLLHGFGVVCGLDLAPTAPPSSDAVVLEPGLAIDSHGREIVVDEAAAIHLASCPGAEILEAAPDVIYVTLEYLEKGIDLVPVDGGPESGPGTQPDRILETYSIGLRSEPAGPARSPSTERALALAGALREGTGREDLLARLATAARGPCPDREAAPILTLAAIRLPKKGPITASAIDNRTDRPVVVRGA